jgi:hypothetical protein
MPASKNILKTLKKLIEQSPADQTEALLMLAQAERKDTR